jgi:hypothetical protein
VREASLPLPGSVGPCVRVKGRPASESSRRGGAASAPVSEDFRTPYAATPPSPPGLLDRYGTRLAIHQKWLRRTGRGWSPSSKRSMRGELHGRAAAKISLNAHGKGWRAMTGSPRYRTPPERPRRRASQLSRSPGCARPEVVTLPQREMTVRCAATLRRIRPTGARWVTLSKPGRAESKSGREQPAAGRSTRYARCGWPAAPRWRGPRRRAAPDQGVDCHCARRAAHDPARAG